MKYRNYIFDLYGTLIDIQTNEGKHTLWKKLSELYACFGAVYEPKQLKKTYQKMIREEEELLRRDTKVTYPEIRLENVFLRMQKEAPGGSALQIRDEEVWAEMLANIFRVLSRNYIRLFPDTLDTLSRLKKEGCRLYLLSNAQAVFTMSEIRIMGIDTFFDKMYLSSDFGMKKPEPDFLRQLLSKENLPLEETVMIGNEMESDMKVADACGVDGIYINLLNEDKEQIEERKRRAGISQEFAVVRCLGECRS